MSWENEDDSSTDSDDDEVENICLMANDENVSVGVKKSRGFVDNVCSKHMTTNEESLINYKPIDEENVIYGDNSKGKVISIGNVDSFDSLTLDSEEKEKIDDSTRETKDDQVEEIESSTQEDQGMHEEQATHQEEQPSMIDLMRELQFVNRNIGRLGRKLHRVEQHLGIQDDEENQD
ncbi:hypothetical protein PIB30_063163 [Stylosanthes scabra]|uniref:Retrovirus-related Pol polyprotein from transposon TNT 1-94-like beta-barrel domain-containing protein n=1 Tax=Stylosanthes scabra TaxID=79078 RepID=A0ABU6XJA3_9FABA|nr:hypothetical protein [Stylosanthes scabra]